MNLSFNAIAPGTSSLLRDFANTAGRVRPADFLNPRTRQKVVWE
jgi:hypothetical protein